MAIIEVSKLGKAYKWYPNRWLRLVELLVPGKKPRHRLRWVIQDVSFVVHSGEAVGIIGINGAGKSTLLKMIAGTTQPSVGTVKITGKVAALLELGMGFHPDFTGRQNVLMSGQLLGYTANQIADLMPAIEAFAEIGEYIDQPVRVYSSGMQMRLAFSVATASRPDVLIVDEALSVGDTYFQHKSFDRIRKFRDSGTTLLIVSHDSSAIKAICSKAILMNNGTIVKQGSPEDVLDLYNALVADRNSNNILQNKVEDGKIRTIHGTGEAKVTGIKLMGPEQQVSEVFTVGQTMTMHVDVKVNAPIERLIFGYGIKDRLGQVIYGTNTHLKEMPIINAAAGSEYSFLVKFNANLGPGSYSIQTSLTSTEDYFKNNYEWVDMAKVFAIENNSMPYFAGCAWIDPEITIQKL